MSDQGRLLLLRTNWECSGASVTCRGPKERRDTCRVRVECVYVWRERENYRSYAFSGNATWWWKELAVNPKIILLLFIGVKQI